MSMEAALLNILAGRAEPGKEAKRTQYGGVPERAEPKRNEPVTPLSAAATAAATPMSTATVAQEAQAAKPRAASPTKLSRAPSPAKSTTSSEVFPNYDSAYSNSTTYVLLVPVPLLNDHDLPSLTAARSATSSQGDRYSNDCRATDPYANSPEDQEMLDQMEKAMEVASASTEGLSPYDTDLKHLHTAVEAAKLDFKVWEQGEGNKEIQSQVLRRLAQTWFPGDRYGMPETKVEE